MGLCRPFTKEKLIMGILFSQETSLQPLYKSLESYFGETDYRSEILSFSYTNYYNAEMGKNIQRQFLSFKKLYDPQELSTIKIQTNRLEEQWAIDGKRPINLDPGFLALGRLVLATTKNEAHRIPLQKEIYGELTLMFRKGDFTPLPWTYADYRSNEYRALLRDIRQIYKSQLRESDK